MAAAPASPTEIVGWRGDGTGRYPAATMPLQWDGEEGKNILWQTKVGKGQSVPLAAGGRVFVTAEPDLLTCLDLADGRVLWTQPNGYASLPAGAATPKEPPPTSPQCGYSAPSPVTDGKQVYASYGTGVVVAYDSDGKRRWVRHLDLPLVTQYGRSVSPVIVDGKLLVGIGGVVALDPKTGETLWQTPEAKPTYGTPAVARIGDVTVVFTPNGDCLRVGDGKVLARKLAKTTYTSPLVANGVLYYGDAPVSAFKLPDRAGDTIKPASLWDNDDVEGELFASPLLHEGILYVATNEGVLFTIEAETGKTIYKKELEIRAASGKPGAEPANIYPSVTLAGKHILVSNDVGESLVLEPGREYKQVGRNDLAKGSGASLVPEGRFLVLRGADKVFCIGSKTNQ